VVFVVGVVLEFRIVDGVEEDHGSNTDLGKWSNTNFLGLHVLMLPAPESYKNMFVMK